LIFLDTNVVSETLRKSPDPEIWHLADLGEAGRAAAKQNRTMRPA
jgi:predicted nucleic acid-binding protein